MTRPLATQYWISVFLLLFLSFSLLVPWSAFYRGFLFVGALPITIWAYARWGDQMGIKDGVLWLALGLLAYVSGSIFFMGGSSLDAQYQTLRWALTTALFVLAVYAASQYWLLKPLAYARLLVGMATLSGALVVIYYFSTDQYPARISGTGFLNHPILGAASLVSFWAIGMVMYQAGERRTRFDMTLMSISVPIVLIFVTLSQSRGPFAALLLFLVAFILSILLVQQRPKQMRYITGVIGLVLVLGVLSTVFLDDILARMVERGTSYRPQIWIAVLQNSTEALWFGTGAASDFTNSSAGDALFEQIGVRIKHPHNLLLGVLHYSGAVGVALFIALLLCTLVRLLRLSGAEARRFKPFGLSLFLLILLLNITDGHRVVAPPSPEWLFFWLPLAFLIGATHTRSLDSRSL